jgi:DNA-binding transcriptional regulator LsrR (DeoR family)
MDAQRLLVKIARLYYEQGLTQHDIAVRLRLSRQKVQRLIVRAREEGVVHIVIHPIIGGHDDLEAGLERAYGLREAVVVETTGYEDEATVAKEIGVGAADYFLRVVQPKDRIVVSWGGSLFGMVSALARYPRKTCPEIRIIQGLGTVVDPNLDAHSAELVRRMARAFDGQAVLLPAPGVASSQAARGAFYSDANVAAALQEARRATLCLMGIGAPRPDSLLVREGSIVAWPELAELISQGAVGDINLRYFDARGQAVLSDIDARVVGLTLQEIRQIGHVVGIAGGAAKLQAIRGALIGKLIDVLVTDHITAGKLLSQK